MGNDVSTKKNTSGKLSDKELAVLKAATKKSDKELQDDYAEFLTRCPTGQMDKKEFKKLYQEAMGGQDADGALCDNIFAVFDTNHDGTVSYSEFVLVMAATESKDPDATYNIAFSLLDTSGDGKISFPEVVAFCEGGMKIAGQSNTGGVNGKLIASYIFGELGVDEGEKLNKQQFVEGCKKSKDLGELFGSFGSK